MVWAKREYETLSARDCRHVCHWTFLGAAVSIPLEDADCDDERVILKGKVGELATADDYSLFVAGFESHNDFEFSISQRSRLEAIEWLKSSLSLSEQGKQTGILKLSFEGENKQQISEILNHISQIYFLQNVKRNSAEAEKSLEFLESHLPGIKSELTAMAISRLAENHGHGLSLQSVPHC